MAARKDFQIERGKTFSQVLRWETPPYIYKPITAISQTAPVNITCPGHGIPNGWRVAIVSVKGMLQINAMNSPPKEQDYMPATVVDADTIQINEINASDFKPYVSGGYVQFNTPVDLTGFSARMSIKDKVGGTEMIRLDDTNGRITLSNTDKVIALVISATDTADMNFKKGVYDLELVSSTGVVTALLSGSVSISQEVTT